MLGAVDRQDVDALRAVPGGAVDRGRLVGGGLLGRTSDQGQVGEALGDAHRATSRASRVRVRKATASTPIAQESSTRSGGTLASPGLPASTTRAAPASRSAATRSAPPLGVGRVGAGQADDRLAGVRREHVVGPRRSRPATSTATPPAASRLVAKVARGGVRGDRAHRGQEDRACRQARRAAPRRPRRSAARAIAATRGRSGSASSRFGNSVTPVSGRFRVGDLAVARGRRPRRSATAATRRPRPTRRHRRLDPAAARAQAAAARSSVSFSTA